MARTRPFNCGVDVCMCRTAVVRGRIHCRERAVSGPCTRPCTRPVYTVVYWPRIWRVHGLVTAVYTYASVHGCVHGRERAVYTARTGRVGPCRRPCTCRVQGRGLCTRLVRSVLLRFSLQKTLFIPKRTAINALHSKRARTTSPPSAALRRTTVLRTMFISAMSHLRQSRATLSCDYEVARCDFVARQSRATKSQV